MAQNRRSTCSQRQADGDLAPAADYTHQQQTCKVGARNKQHHRDSNKKSADQRARTRNRGLIERLNPGMNAAPGERRRKVALDFLGSSRSLLLSLRGGHARFQAAYQVVRPGAGPLNEFILRNAHWNPKFAAVQLPRHQRKFEIARHDANNLVRLAIELNLLANDVGVAMKAAAPGLVAEHGHLHRALIFLLCKAAAHQRRDAQGGKHAGRQARCIDLRGNARAGEFIRSRRISAQAGESMRIADIDLNSRSRDAGSIVAIVIHAFQVVAERDQPAGLGKRQRPQQGAFDNRKDRRSSADPQR